MNIDKICEQLTIDEKIRLLGGVGDWHTYDCNGKIPSIMMTDGPHGIRKLEQEKVGDIETSKPATCFPTASAIACSWNPAIVKKMGEAIAKEAKKEQISIVLGCGININVLLYAEEILNISVKIVFDRKAGNGIYRRCTEPWNRYEFKALCC